MKVLPYRVYESKFDKILKKIPSLGKLLSSLFGISECYYKLGYIQSALIGYSQVLKIRPDFQPAIDRLNEVETTVSENKG